MGASWRPWIALAVLTLALTTLRVAWILNVHDVDMDAYGHFAIARGLCSDPWNLAAHWVWLPLYHFLLTAIACTGHKFVTARVLSALVIAALPFIVYRYDGRGAPERSATAFWAAVFCALTAIPNAMGVSAQQESLFTLCILLAAWFIDTRRFAFAGVLLAAACLVRYEAWGGAGLVMLQAIVVRVARSGLRAPEWLRSMEPISLAVAIAPAVVIVGWILLHRWVDGSWLGFLGELYRYTHAQREVLSRGSLMGALWFPLLVPVITFGPLVLVVPWGMRGAVQGGWILPIGIYSFLLASYAGQGVLGGQRYYGSLTPFICIAMAHGVDSLVQTQRRLRLTYRATLATIALATMLAFLRLGRSAGDGATTLSAAEARMNHGR